MLAEHQSAWVWYAGFGVEDAMKQVRSIRALLKRQETEVVELNRKLNNNQRVTARLFEENKILRYKAGVPADWGLSEEAVDLQQRLQVAKLQAQVLHSEQVLHTLWLWMRVALLSNIMYWLLQVIRHLEAERVRLLDELRQGAVESSEAGLRFMGLSVDQTNLLQQYAVRFIRRSF